MKLIIDTEEKLRLHLKLMKKQLLNNGCHPLNLYPAFCVYLDKHKEKYALPKLVILDAACEILIES